MMDESRFRSRSIMLVGTLTILSKLAAVFRQIVLTYFYGATNISDAYILAQSIPNTLFMLVVAAIGISFIPIYSQVLNELGKKDAEDYTSRMINAIVLLASIVVAFTLIFSRQIVFIFASGFNDETAEIAIEFVRISIFSLYFLGVNGIFCAYLKINNLYFFPSIIGVALSTIEIISCFIAAKFNDIFLAIGIIAAVFAQFIIVFLASLRHGYKWRKGLGIIDLYVKKALIVSLPILVSYGIDEINIIIDKSIASRFDAGSISILNYSNSIVSIIHNIITVSIYTVLFSEVSKLAVTNDKKKISEQIQKAFHSALFLLIPAMIGLIIFSKPIIQILFERGSFNHTATMITSGTMSLYALSILPNGIRMLSQTYFYSYGKTKFCMYVGVFAVVVNILLNIILSHLIGIYGLALASSIAIAIAAVIHLIKFCNENQDFQLKVFLNSIFKILTNSIIMAIASYYIYASLCHTTTFLTALITAIIAAIIIYFSLSILTHTLGKSTLDMILHQRR